MAWGGLHGAYLIGERLVRARMSPAPWRASLAARLAAAALTFLLVCVAWVFFRATSFGQAFALLGSLLGGDAPALLPWVSHVLVGVSLSLLLVTHWQLRGRSLEAVVERTPWPARSAALAAMIVTIILMQGQDRAFIYFQF